MKHVQLEDPYVTTKYLLEPNGLFFVGKLSFQIMNGLGMTVPSQFIERNAVKEVLQIIQSC